MTNPRIFVTGAAGRTGNAVVTHLLAKGWPVRAAVRVRDARSDLLQSRGAEVVVADIFDSGQLTDAMRGVQRAYYCPPYHPFVIQSAVAFADAAPADRTPWQELQRSCHGRFFAPDGGKTLPS